jgi:hypothetical protein
MPRGSAPGERRGGRRKGIPNRRTVLFEQAIVKAAVSGDGDAVDFLTRIYEDPKIPLSVRIDCAKVVAPFQRPRLTAVTDRDGKDLAQILLPPAEYRAWARQQIREAFDMPPLTFEHRAEGEDAS